MELVRDIVIREDAMRRLLEYRSRNQWNARRLDEVFAQLRGYGLLSIEERSVPTAQGSLFVCAIEPATRLYFTIGLDGSIDGRSKVRVLHFGPHSEDNDSLTRRLLWQAGELAEPSEARPPKAGLVRIEQLDQLPSASVARPEAGGTSAGSAAAEDDSLQGCFLILSDWCETDDLVFDIRERQKRFVDAPGPFLLQGIAGSGKTTVLVHRAARLAAAGETVLLVVYNRALRSYAESLLRRLKRSQPMSTGVDIMTYRELCESLADRLQMPAFPWLNDIERIRASLKAHRTELGLTRALSLDELQEEIRAVVKGACLTADEPLLSLDDYVAHGATYSLHAEAKDRASLHSAAQRYQNLLVSLGKVDDMDAARILLQRVPTLRGWDEVLVDEVQDYTLVQLCLLVRLARSVSGLTFAGDEHQIVYPSAFSWNRVKDALHKGGCANPPDPSSLNFNFRNSQPIAQLGYSVLAARARILNGGDPPRARTTSGSADQPQAVRLERTEIEPFLKGLATGVASLGILYEDEESVDRNQWELEGIGFRRGYSPQSAKGIEFDVVCLVRFHAAYADLFATHGRRDLRGSTATRYFRFNEVYVGVSRARHLLILLDTCERGLGFWDADEFGSKIQRADAGRLLSEIVARFGIADERSWRVAAHDFDQQDAQEAAAECWQRAGDWRKAGEALVRAGSWERAALLFDRAGETTRAAEAYSAAGRMREAAERWQNLEKYALAARAWDEVAEPAKAAHCWEQAGQWAEAAVSHTHNRNAAQAAKAWSRAGRHAEAAACWEDLAARQQASADQVRACYDAAAIAWASGPIPGLAESWMEKAADANIDALNLRRAYYSMLAEAYSSLGQLDRAAQAWKQAGHPKAAARLWSEIGEEEKAARAYAACGDKSEAVRIWTRIGNAAWARAKALDRRDDSRRRTEEYLKAAQAWHEAGLSRQEADALELAGQRAKAAALYAEVGELARAARLWKDEKQYLRSVTASVRAGDIKTAVKTLSEHSLDDREVAAWRRKSPQEAKDTILEAVSFLRKDKKWFYSAKLLNAAGEFAQAAADFQKAEKPGEAAAAWSAAGEHSKAAEVYHSIAHHREAAREWSAAGNHVEAARTWTILRCDREAAQEWRAARDWQQSADAWIRAGNLAEAAIDWLSADQPERAAACFLKVGDLEAAAKAFETAGQHEHAVAVATRNPAYLNAISLWKLVERRLDDFTRCQVRVTPGKLEETRELTRQAIIALVAIGLYTEAKQIERKLKEISCK